MAGNGSCHHEISVCGPRTGIFFFVVILFDLMRWNLGLGSANSQIKLRSSAGSMANDMIAR